MLNNLPHAFGTQIEIKLQTNAVPNDRPKRYHSSAQSVVTKKSLLSKNTRYHAAAQQLKSTLSSGTTTAARAVPIERYYHFSANMWAQNVAKIGSMEYADLATALNACQAGETVELLSDITLTGNWTPIVGFKGILNGQNKTISGLTVSGAGYVGLFKSLDGNTIKDLTISGANITSTGNKAGVLAGEVASGSIVNVTIDNCTVTSTGEYVGGLFGIGYSNVKTCTVEDCNIKGKDQVGGFIGYMWVGDVLNSTASNNTIIATDTRAGGLIGKVQFAKDNIGPVQSSKMTINGNTISGTTIANGVDGVVGGLAAQIMGDDTRFEIKNNTINVNTGGTTSPIGVLRDGQNAAFTGALEENITGNWWSDATLNADSYQYTNVASGVEVQTIYRKQPYTRQVATGNWATMCYPYSITVVTGATIYQITAINSAKTQVALDVVDVLSMVPGRAYLFNATANNQSFTAFPGSSVAEPIQNNGLIGTFASIKLQEQAWVLTNNTITPAAVGSTVGQYRCYIDLDEVSVDDTQFTSNAPGRKFFGVRGVATNVEELMFDNAQCTKVIINGQFVIVKDGKMFNAQGAQL